MPISAWHYEFCLINHTGAGGSTRVSRAPEFALCCCSVRLVNWSEAALVCCSLCRAACAGSASAVFCGTPSALDTETGSWRPPAHIWSVRHELQAEGFWERCWSLKKSSVISRISAFSCLESGCCFRNSWPRRDLSFSMLLLIRSLRIFSTVGFLNWGNTKNMHLETLIHHFYISEEYMILWSEIWDVEYLPCLWVEVVLCWWLLYHYICQRILKNVYDIYTSILNSKTVLIIDNNRLFWFVF